MDKKYCLFLEIVVCLIVISESRVIVPRALPEDGTSGNEELPLSINPLEKDNKFDFKPVISSPRAVDDDYNDYKENIDPVHRPFDDDYDYLPGRGVSEEDNLPGTNPERVPDEEHRDEEPQEVPEEKDSNDKADDETFNKPFDEEDFAKTDNDDKVLESIPDEDKPIQKNGDKDEAEVKDNGTEEPEDEDSIDNKPQDEEKLDEEKIDEDKPDEENLDEERKDKEKDESEDNDEKQYVPKEEEESIDDENKGKEMPKEIDEETVNHEDDNNVDETIPEEEEPGSFFDTPFFSLEQVKKYFSQLDRALGHVFRQTVDEAVLLNGTYANTTEEEVDINGKKYIVTKSVIKGADNDSMMYVEALSAKPKMNDSEVVLNIDVKNVTKS